MNNPEPIKDYHQAFATELVALCRKHRVQNIEATFYGAMLFGNKPDWKPFHGNRVTLSWEQGRHGDSSDISLSAQATADYPEIPSPPFDTGGD